MAITKIGGRFLPESEILQRLTNAGLFLFNSQPGYTTKTVNPPSNDAILIQAQQVINETLQGLTSPGQASLRLNRALNNLSFSQQVEVLIQSRILLDTALEYLGSSLESPFLTDAKALINETLTRLNVVKEADLLKQPEIPTNEALQNLNPTQVAEGLAQAETSANTALQNLTNLPGQETFYPPELLGIPETTLPSSGAFTTPRDNNPLQFEPGPIRLGSNETTTAAQAQAQNLEEAALSINQTTTAETTSPSEVVSQQTALPIPIGPIEPVDPIPYGIAVYEVNSQKTAPLDTELETISVKPTQPVEKTGLSNLIFHWPSGEQEKEEYPPLYIPYNQLTEEEALRKIIHHFNENQASKNHPTRLVLVRDSKGLSLDLYDSSDNIVCRLAYNAPLGSSGLTKILDQVQDDQGVFLNIKT